MKSIDFKSLLIGILGTALVMVLMGQATHKKRYDVECITMSGKAGLIKCRRFQLDVMFGMHKIFTYQLIGITLIKLMHSDDL